MASSTEESHDVKAIKLHISTIKSQISITTNNVSSAKSNMDAAIAMYASLQSQLDVSKKELNDVEKLLAEAEQRAIVNDNVNVEGGSNKRRKVSPPPQDDANNQAGVTIKMEQDSDHYDDETDKEDGDKEDGKEEDDDGSTKPPATNNTSANDNNPAGSRQSNDMNDGTTGHQESTNNNKEALGSSAASTASQSTSDVDQVIVEGCGVFKDNGMYTKVAYKNRAPVYSKRVVCSNGNTIIYRDSNSMGPNNWFIGYCSGNVISFSEYNRCYGSPNNTDSVIPPTNGWEPLNDCVGPAPSCRILYTKETVTPPNPLKKCGKCGKPKKRHSYKVAEWDKRKDDQRKCQVCI